MSPNIISLRPSSIVHALEIVALLLILASTGVQLTSYLTGHNNIYGLVKFFYIDAEQNISTFFSAFLLLFATLILGVIIILEKKQTTSYISHWTILVIGFLYMAFDKAVSIDEILIRPTRMLFGNGRLGLFYFSRGIPSIALIIAFTLALGLFFLKFLLHLPSKTRFTFLIAAILYTGGAICLDRIGSRYMELHGDNWMYKTISTTEESLEMAGIIIFIQALLAYIADSYKELRIQFDIDDRTKS